MENKILFNLDSSLGIKEGANFEDVVANLQKFTSKHLYIDTYGKLRSVDNFCQLPYGKCRLMNVESGFLLEIESTKKFITVFSRAMSDYLTLVHFPETFSFEKYDSEESIEFQEFQGFEGDISEDDFYISDEDTSENIISEENIVSQSEQNISEATIEEFPSDEDMKESFFRLFIRDIKDTNYDSTRFIGSLEFREIEEKNDMNLEETIKMSFESFLENKGYENPKTYLYFTDEFVQICIDTHEELTDEIIEKFEDEAHLEIEGNQELYFVYDVDERNNEVKEMISNFYSREVPLSRLPKEFTEIVLEKAKGLMTSRIFTYDNSIFGIRREESGIYSLFDFELYFKLSHLFPCLYSEVYKYNELPVAQFYL